MRRKLLLLLVVALSTTLAKVQAGILPPPEIQPGLLFKHELLINSSVNNFDASQFDLDLTFFNNQLFPTNLVRLFDDVVVSESSVGMKFERTAADGPAFSAVVDRLTDASNEFIRIVLTEVETGGLSEQRGWQESIFFLNGDFSTATGLAEATITSIGLEVKRFNLLPNEAAGTDDPIDVLLEFTIQGTATAVPEPASLWLLASGLVSMGRLMFFRRRRLPVAA